MPPPNNKRWSERFEQAKAYHDQHGIWATPAYAEDTSLGEWCGRQRYLHGQGKLPLDRFRKLDAIGFPWSLKKNCGKPNASKSGARSDNSNKPPKKKSPKKKSPKDKPSVYDQRWLAQYHRLEAFKKKKGHVDVPRGYADKSLAMWVSYQRTRNSTGGIPPDRKKLLEEIGFSFWGETQSSRNTAKVGTKAAQEEVEVHEIVECKIGTKVRKEYDIGWFDGVVTAKGPTENTWCVLYEDDEEEYIDLEELEDIADNYREFYNSSNNNSGGGGCGGGSAQSGSAASGSRSGPPTLLWEVTSKKRMKVTPTFARDTAASGAPESSSEKKRAAIDSEDVSEAPASKKKRAPSIPPQAAATTAQEDNAYTQLSPVFFQLCQTLNASPLSRGKIPVLERKFKRWIRQEEAKQAKAAAAAAAAYNSAAAGSASPGSEDE